MLLVGGGALVASAALVSERRVEAGTESFSGPNRSVSAISGSDSDFSSAVGALFPGLVDDPVFQKIVPLALLVTHQQGPAVRAFSVSWAITTSAGTFEVPSYFYVSVGSVVTGHILSSLGSARRDILPSSQSRLVTPFFNWTPAYYQSNPTPDWKKVLTPTEPGAFLVSELLNATQVKVSLDGVVFSDWKMIGPDKHTLGLKIRERRNAERDEGLMVYKLMTKGASDSEIIQALQTDASAARSNRKNLKGRWYQQSRRFHAQVLLRAFQDADRPTFTAALTRLKRQRKTVITRADV